MRMRKRYIFTALAIAILVLPVVVAFNLPHGTDDRAEQLSIAEVASPFAEEATAYLIQAPQNQRGFVYWQVSGLIPDRVYSVSFFYARAGVDYVDPTRQDLGDHLLHLTVHEGSEIVYQNGLMPTAQPRFVMIPLVFGQPKATIQLAIPQGKRIVMGHIGEVIGSRQLKHPDPYYGEDENRLRSPDDTLPEVYRGLRDFEIVIHARRDSLTTPILPRIQQVLVRAEMAATTALFPRILPGKNTLLVRADSAGAAAAVHAAISPTDAPWATLQIDADPMAPADGATFARVRIAATNDRGHLLPGLFFRLQAPKPLVVVPFDLAVSDAPQDNRVRHFHITSVKPGTYTVPVDVWAGRGWQPTSQTVQITFEPAIEAAPGFVWSKLANAWYEPEAITGDAELATQLEAVWRGSDPDHRLMLDIDSVTMPHVAWSISGPVKNLRIFNSAHQPDPATIWTLGQSLRERVMPDGIVNDRQLALDARSYIGITRRSNIQANYDGQQTYFPGRVLRKGRGLCGPHAKALFAVAVAAGLRARVAGTSQHTVTEVTSDTLDPTMLDAQREVFVCHPDGTPGSLDLLTTADVRFLGFGVKGKTRRGDNRQEVLDNYYDKRRNHALRWYEKSPVSTPFRIMFHDDRLLAFDLQPWEKVSWAAGMIDPTRVRTDDKRYQQTMLVKEAVLQPGSDMKADEVASSSGFTSVTGGIQVSPGMLRAKLQFPFRAPVEVDQMTVAIEGQAGDDGSLTVDIRPVLPSPVITGPPDNLPLK